ncbi:uncharacterized protein [Littorina saxatilis]|uniref:uncharacterized protein n=1 Tax=Littorina saxatilis TaxID=31220 RepID=UPI0038B5C99B
MEADEVTVVVHGARNLQGKKPGRCKFSVIFGVGTRKFRTSIVKEASGNPDWNEESNVCVQSQADHVFFTVTEKEDVLGQVTIPVTSLTNAKGQVRKTTLKAHKKCPDPHGELLYQAYVSKQRPLSTAVSPQIRGSNTIGAPAQLTGFARLRHSLAISPALPRRAMKRDSKDSGSLGGEKEERRKSSTLSFFNKKLSKSLHDIFHIGRMAEDDDEHKPSNKNKFGSMSSGLDRAEIPIVSNVIPNMATVHGGTKLCIEGRNLGLGKSDIMEFMLCGSDLLDSIEFESETRIYVTTKPSSAGKGDLWIETVSGGQNVIKNVFTFVDRTAEKNGTLERQVPPSPIIIPPSPKRDAPEPSPKAPPRGKSSFGDIDFSSPSGTDRHRTSVHRSSSQQEKSTSNSLGVSSTLPRVKSTTALESDEEPEPSGRFKKNHQKHARRASESVVVIQRDTEGRSSASDKADLQKEIVRLMKENQDLQKKNDDLNTYIANLVAKVIEKCPDVLSAMPKQ